MQRGAVIVGLVLILIAWPLCAFAEPPSPMSLVVGGRLWLTGGYSTNALDVGDVKPRSDLRWRGVDAAVGEVNVDFLWKRLVVMSSLGGGGINQGVLIDEDFSQSNHQGRFSRTRSDVDGDGLFYINADVGVRALTWARGDGSMPGFLDALLGYQYWRENYVAFGITSLFPEVVPPAPNSVKVISQDYTWHSLRIGARTQVELISGLSLKARAFILPWSKHILEDVHHLRGDLKQDPSFRDEADGGFGVQLDGGLAYRVWRTLTVEVGYQYWRLDSGSGTSTARTVFGDVTNRLPESTTERHGPYIGVQYRF